MTHADFEAAALDVLKNYWRIKAANALYLGAQHVASGLLEYTHVPQVGVTTNLLSRELAADALVALRDFVAQRLPRDLLLALIAEFESRLVSRLSALGKPTNGTLGGLQKRIQANVVIPSALAEDLDEVRERRNAMIHNADKAGAKYVAACAIVLPRAHPYVAITAEGNKVTPDPAYLAYGTDVLVRYSKCIG
jgi:hypothetical protein